MENDLVLLVKKAKTVFPNADNAKTYVVIECEDRQTKTNVVVGKNPVWHGEFRFNVLDMRGALLLKLMQSGFFFDQEICFVKIPFIEITFASKSGPGKWFQLMTLNDGNINVTENEILLDARFALPTGLTAEEENALSQKLSMLNEVLNEEVNFISRQHQKIQEEGFQIPKEKITSTSEQLDTSVFTDESSMVDEEPFVSSTEQEYQEEPDDDFDDDDRDDRADSVPVIKRRSISSDDLQSIIQRENDSGSQKDENDEDEQIESHIHNSDTEVDRHVGPKRRNASSSLRAKKNWMRALDDIKKARQSGIYASFSDTDDVMKTRERVISILQFDSDTSGRRRIRPKSAGDALLMRRAEDSIEIHEPNESEHEDNEEERAESQDDEALNLPASRFVRKPGFRHSPRTSRRRNS